MDGSDPVPLVKGQATHPIWSPTDDKLIVYSGPLEAGRVKLLGVTPDGVSVEFPEVYSRQGAYRFLRDGTGLVYLPRIQSGDFSLLDLTTKQSRAITRLSNHGYLTTFDITPDGKEILFDRSRENSNIVLIDLPK